MATYKRRPPRPRNESDLVSTLSHFANGIARNPARYHLREDQATKIRETVQAYGEAHTLSCCGGTRTPIVMSEKEKKRRKAEQLHSKYYNLIKADPEISDEHKRKIGVLPVNLKRTAIHVPNRPPRITVAGAALGQHTLLFRDDPRDKVLQDADAPLGGKGKPHGAIFIQVYVALGEDKQQPRDSAREVGLFTRNPIVVEYPEKDNRKQACYWARWISRTGQTGPWSPVVSMAVAA